ncbi:zinc finger, CCHC-type, Retrotransposon gag domain protein [Artemisia annua]|uniref:Zinc finger, CCHC-type, Retrotransposon gag domain protein n=1 Tax=Artemisia annua TaxID=35608 RepID=A0A2U1N9Y3_ARTAN|nr:zinc finger, CCHC-type, Retrotransposon gag domain protein [Artemisia annua]
MIFQMVTTRTQDKFANNPAFEAAVQQSVNALLPRIREEMREEVRQEMANSAGSSGGGGNQPETIHAWLERFNKQKPHSFSTVTSPDDAEHWIAHMEKIFEVLGCGDIFKARLATYKFEGDALNWWKAYKYAKGGDNANEYVATLSWASFREIFRSQYFPLSEKEKYEREYHTIAMTDKETSTEFMKRFVRLAGFLGAKAGTQAEQANKFKWALRQDLLNGVVNLKFDDIAGVANAIRNIETADERVKHGVKRNFDDERVRPTQGSSQRGSDSRGSDRWVQDTRRSDRQGYERSGYDGRRYDRQDDRWERSGRDRQQRGQQEYRNTGGRGDGDVCKTCGKSHPGRQCHRVSGACFNCSQTGHLARDCPKPAGYNQGAGRDRALTGQQHNDTTGTVSDNP